MRSVFFHLREATRQEVADYISTIATPNGPEDWLLYRNSSDPVLYVSFYNDTLTESDPDELDLLISSLGTFPSVTVTADVSGKFDGDTEVRELALLLLNKFKGVAWDDHTCHCWTISEIHSNVAAHGHVFFDYKGWGRAGLSSRSKS